MTNPTAKVYAIKVDELGKAPYFLEYHLISELVIGGIKSVTGRYHEYPRRVIRVASKPYHEAYATERTLKRLMEDPDYDVEFI